MLGRLFDFAMDVARGAFWLLKNRPKVFAALAGGGVLGVLFLWLTMGGGLQGLKSSKRSASRAELQEGFAPAKGDTARMMEARGVDRDMADPCRDDECRRLRDLQQESEFTLARRHFVIELQIAAMGGRPPEDPEQEEPGSGGWGTKQALDEGKMGRKDSDRAAGQYAMRQGTGDPALARAQAIEDAKTAGVLGSAAIAQGGSFASLTGTGDIASGADRPADPAAVPADPAAAADPCAAARDVANGEPLVKALAGLRVRAPKPADGSAYEPGMKAATDATVVSPECADAWASLAFASYRRAYDICGRGDYARALEAAEKAFALGSTPDARAAALRNKGRIQASMLAWDDAEATFRRAQIEAPLNKEAQSWLDDLAIRKAPRPELLALVKRVLAGETIVLADLDGFSAPELGFAANGALVKYGRRLNAAPVDWFYYCDGSPLDSRPTMDPAAASAPVPKGSVDQANQKLLDGTARTRRTGATPAAVDGTVKNPF